MDKSAGEEKSITDYVLTDASSANTVKEMKIDEEKQYGLHKLYKNTATNENRKIYSDHNSILINLDFDTPTEEERPKKIITKEGYKRYRTIIEEENVSKLLKSGDLQESYNKWSIAIETSIKTVQKTKTKNTRKDIKELQKIRKRLREEYSTTVELHEKILILERIKTLKEHITEKYKEGRSKRINRVAQEIRQSVDSEGKICGVKRRIEKKVQTPYSITTYSPQGSFVLDRTPPLALNFYTSGILRQEISEYYYLWLNSTCLLKSYNGISIKWTPLVHD